MEAFRYDLGLRVGLLYGEHRGRFQLMDTSGDVARSLPETIDKRAPFIAPILEHHVYIFPQASDPISPASCGVMPPGPAAGLVVELAASRYLLLFALDATWSHETLDFCLNTLRAALTARLMEAHLRGSLRETAAIQQSLLPRRPPIFHDYDVAGRSQAAEEVGGDFYDFLVFENDLLGIAIGDASGHGLPAALMARDVLIGLRMGLERQMKVTHTLTKLNHVIHNSSLSSRFASLFYAELEPGGTLVYANAGHEPPLLFDEGRMTRLPKGDTIIGPLPEVFFKRRFTHLDRGGLLALCTDGIIERQSAAGEVFGVERMSRVIERHRARPAGEILEEVFAAADKFAEQAPWEDDATLVVVKRPG